MRVFVEKTARGGNMRAKETARGRKKASNVVLVKSAVG
ncbi:hypothetical protein T11_16534 [Trichinella zimbabwensis]|uniref:Uncharacterized protein n=1 Tax=Trichinella zimbabwensis TaxID=268475 RepID=A0A0V1DXH5_9BILA|nr:hypothetical protein T11_16534 [Trichinella zimbabwensis]